MARRNVEEELARLSALKRLPDHPSTATLLRKALRDRIGLIVARAAEVTAYLQQSGLTPDLLSAFDRMFVKPAEIDPKCWAKNAIVRALVDLGHTASAPFLRGLYHVQMEPVWGGSEDSAIALRGACALALVSARDLPRQDVFENLVQALTDGYTSGDPGLLERCSPVRADAIRAIEEMSGQEARLLLRLKARAGDVSPGVVGRTFDSLLRLDTTAVGFVTSFLSHAEPAIREEAALALGSSPLPAAVEALVAAWRAGPRETSTVILQALIHSRQDSAMAFLLDLLRTASRPEALQVLSGLALHGTDKALRQRIGEVLRTRGENPILIRFRELFNDQGSTF